MLVKRITRLVERFGPSREALSRSRIMRPAAKYIANPNVWHFNRHSVARGVALGLFLGFAIPMGLQLLLSALLAVSARANLAVTALFTSVSNPLTIIPICYAAIKTGDWLLGVETPLSPHSAALLEIVKDAPVPMVVGCIFFAVISAALGFMTIQFAWRWWIARRWQRRLARSAQQA
ncbi:DUF2062 domain-containing protein [Pacificimonas flava]|uniref:DUF2062 domain-containing protein n=1 Tax=Pacificimonas flava TaxID=1234595 RepID=M2TCZ8_9SPHN|nr:DUF2062 domain-containing protein [Pacificimonas flava]EMD84384.1 hypothetical protein C725_0314 [Pacificimonas flava]MBB5279742.1 hypothetical protein [Pacificimonas flava]